MFKLDNFGVILFVSFSYKKLLQCSFYENLKNRCKNQFFRKKFKKVCVLQRSLYTNSNFQLSRKLKRFRTCRKNKKCSIFHDLSEYIIFSYGCKLLDWSFRVATSTAQAIVRKYDGPTSYRTKSSYDCKINVKVRRNRHKLSYDAVRRNSYDSLSPFRPSYECILHSYDDFRTIACVSLCSCL